MVNGTSKLNEERRGSFTLPALHQWRGEKNAIRASAVENLSTAQRGSSAAGARWLFSPTFFFFFYTILTCTERGASVWCLETFLNMPKASAFSRHFFFRYFEILYR